MEDGVINTSKVNQKVKERERLYPFTSELPYAFDGLLLDYDVNSDDSVVYVVRNISGKKYNKTDYEAKIEQFIRSEGYDPTHVPITWEY